MNLSMAPLTGIVPDSVITLRGRELLREALLLLLKVGGLDEPRRARLALLPTQLGVVVGARRDPVVLSTLLRARGAALPAQGAQPHVVAHAHAAQATRPSSPALQSGTGLPRWHAARGGVWWHAIGQP